MPWRAASETMLSALKERELGKAFNSRFILPLSLSSPISANRPKSSRSSTNFPVSSIGNQINTKFNNMVDTVQRLTSAMDSGKVGEVDHVVQLVLERLLQMEPSDPDEMFVVTASKREERELFVALGGMHQLLRFFEKPFGDKGKGLEYIMHNREFAWSINYYAHVWNDILSILRELIFSIPSLSENVICTHHICFLFAILVHESTFEHTMNLLEEVLGVRMELFSLELAPDFYYLLGKFNLRQLAHFCKVLAHVIFDPEDRQIVDGSVMLRGVDLLNSRRDRLVKPNSIVERNQSIVAEAPQLLEKLIYVLRLVNHGPDLSAMLGKDIMTQVRSPIPCDLMIFTNSKLEQFKRLEALAQQERGTSVDSDDDDPPVIIEDDISAQLLDAFSPNSHADGESSRMNDFNNICHIMQMALNMGLATVTQNGQRMLMWVASTSPDRNATRELESLLLKSLQRQQGTESDSSPTSARHELQFQALLLVPYHLEVLFVLCTLLTGRRKLYLQDFLAKHELASVLIKMFDRMSWYESFAEKTLDHSHGPGCECNPGTALRVQYLRLVHNFFDSDFLFNNNKKLLLSKAERKLLNTLPGRNLLDASYFHNKQRGLMNELMIIHKSDKVETPFKFWLSLCIEAYARGSTGQEQIFLARGGIVSALLQIIRENRTNATQTLQSTFDLLGEVVRFNKLCIELVNGAMDDMEFTQFMDVVLSNLVEGNVFLTALYVSLEVLDYQTRQHRECESVDICEASTSGDIKKAQDSTHLHPSASAQAEENSHSPPPYGYLTHSWVKFAPKPLSKKAIAHTRALSVTPQKPVEQHRTGTHELNPAGKCLHSTKVVYSDNAAGVGRKAPNAAQESGERVSSNTSSDSGVDVDDFGTPPESPKYSRTTSECNIGSDAASDLEELRKDLTKMFISPAKLSNESARKLKGSKKPASPGPGWALTDSTFRLGMFLINERDAILLRLMDIVTIRTINHENICCVNAALTLLLLAHRRGLLAVALENVRRLADKRVALATKGRAKPFSADSSEAFGYEETEEGVFCRPCAPDSSGSELLANFRALLWFWREYYLRRGRDRLSIEFSSRIPFKYWLELINLLCADDGSPTSLLRSPSSIMRSPYFRDGKARPFCD